MPIPGGNIGYGESRPLICNGSNIALPREGHYANRFGISSTFGFFPFLGFFGVLHFLFGMTVSPVRAKAYRGSINYQNS
jgi:hypothetical protein